MVFKSFIKKQFIDVIQWPNPEPEVLMWRFPIQDEEIQNGASLTVRDSQAAMFVDEGVTADVFQAGTFKLTTQNLPVLTNLKNWSKLFESPFKSDVYFFNLRQQLSRRWGTSQPVTVRDADFGAVALRAFGMYSFRIADPALFFKEVTGVTAEYRGEQLEEQLRNVAVTQLATAFGTSNIPFLDMAANQVALSQKMTELLQPLFAAMGLLLESFNVESVTLPEALQKRMDERMGMGIVGDLSRYTQYQTAQAIPIAAQNEGGVAGIGAGLAAGMGMGNAMTAAMMGQQVAPPAQPVQAAPVVAPVAAAPAAGEDLAGKLTQLKTLLDQGLISQADYDTAKAEVIKKITG
ncbi:SPFH domain-containing protein [Vitreoscilla massiliensis]|uniref:SPFH domain-containing protein n=1 Tax=Vitreoscilla massiliensis TaxID=1689272 RepID=A0ABY4E8H3_9NEIS|nr:SPFH domain-containing protein [Vitreoscilla massiliensis]UOO90738.1 SPFH domain-containing protein [Vitreoscilla massiliensis]